MTENGVFHLPLNFSQKWRKQRVEALKSSEIECLGFTERETFAELIFHLSFLFLRLNSLYLYQRQVKIS